MRRADVRKRTPPARFPTSGGPKHRFPDDQSHARLTGGCVAFRNHTTDAATSPAMNPSVSIGIQPYAILRRANVG